MYESRKKKSHSTDSNDPARLLLAREKTLDPPSQLSSLSLASSLSNHFTQFEKKLKTNSMHGTLVASTFNTESEFVIEDPDTPPVTQDVETFKKEQTRILEMIFTPGNGIISCYCAVCDTDVTDGDYIAKSLLTIFRAYGLHIRLQRQLIEREVALTTVPSTLFRRNSMASKTLTCFAKLTGSHFLVAILSEFCQAQVESTTIIEIEGPKLTQRGLNPNDITTYEKNLVDCCEECINCILSSVDQVPGSFRYVGYLLQFYVKQRWIDGNDEAWEKAIAGFFFLRFVCPALVSPELAGLLSVAPDANCKRKFILIAKVLQNLANGTVFSTKGNDYPLLDAWLQQTASRMTAYLCTLATPPAGPLPFISMAPVTGFDLYQSFAVLDHITTSKIDKIIKLVEDEESRRINLMTEPYPIIRDLLNFFNLLKTANFVSVYSKMNPSFVFPGKGPELKVELFEPVELSQAYTLNQQLNSAAGLFPKEKAKKKKGDLVQFVTSLLCDLAEMLRAQHYHWKTIRSSSEFVSIVSKTSHLHDYDINEILSANSKKQKLRSPRQLLFVGFTPIVPTNRVVRIGFFDFFRYQIGDQHWSLNDIYAVLRGNQNEKRFFKKIDPRKVFVLEKTDARIHFGVCQFNQNFTNKFQIYYPTEVEEQLNYAMEWAASHCVYVDVIKNEIRLPNVFQQFEDDLRLYASKRAGVKYPPSQDYIWARHLLDVPHVQDSQKPTKNIFDEMEKKGTKRPNFKVQHLEDTATTHINLEFMKKNLLEDVD